jgi:hypothetical protein
MLHCHSSKETVGPLFFKTCICSLLCYEECVGQERKESGSVEVTGRYFKPCWLGGRDRRTIVSCKEIGVLPLYSQQYRHKLPPPLKVREVGWHSSLAYDRCVQMRVLKSFYEGVAEA